jgi:hypothetical protein
MRRIVAVTVGMLLICTLAACGGDQGNEAAGGPEPSTVPDGEVGTTSAHPGEPTIGVTSESDADLHLWVSNQSFADDPVRITVTIDDTVVVDQAFDVEGQHNWIQFPIEAPPGRHVVAVVSDTGIEMTEHFVLPKAGPRYAVIDYWNYPDEEGRHFTWSFSAEPVAFA